MLPLLLLLPLAQADLVVPPPEDRRYITHKLRIENLESFPDRVFVVVDDGDEVRSHRAFTAEQATHELGRGGRRSGGSLGSPRIRAMTPADYEAWRDATRETVNAQREACQRGEGCAHISRFSPRYAPPKAGVDCGVEIPVQTSAPRDARGAHPGLPGGRGERQGLHRRGRPDAPRPPAGAPAPRRAPARGRAPPAGGARLRHRARGLDLLGSLTGGLASWLAGRRRRHDR